MRILVWLVFGLTFAAGCSYADSLKDAGISYQAKHDYRSLKVIVAHLRKGMPREEVEALLGAPDSEPGEGSGVYSSDREEYVKEADRKLTICLVVEYRDYDDNYRVTKFLQSWDLGPVGE